MKQNIHPKWYPKAKVSCACGSTFESGSTEPEIRVEICSSCHPFFTGQQKFVDTEGRVDRFEKRRKTALKASEQVKQKKAKKEAEKKREKTSPKTLKEILEASPKRAG